MRRTIDRTRAVAIAIACAFAMAGSARANVDVLVSDLSVSGGYVYGNAVILPVGETLTLGTRIVDPTASVIRGLGISYYGYDEALLGFTIGDVVTSLFATLCIPSFGCTSDVANTVTSASLVETSAAPSTVPLTPGPTRVRVFSWIHRAYSGTFSAANDVGLDGLPGNPNGDAHFRLEFEGLSDGYTEITVGTGDDLGGRVFVDVWDPMPAASNAVVRVAVPEPAFCTGIVFGITSLVLARRPRTRESR